MFTTNSASQYTSLEDREKLLEDQSLSSEISYQPPQHKSSLPRWLTIVGHIGLLSATLAFGIYLGTVHESNTDESCTSRLSHDSVVLHKVPIHYSQQQFNGSLFKANAYRQDAGPEVDAAWEALGINYRALQVPEEFAAASGITPGYVKIKSKYGGGYPANVEGLHQLHCLNMLRQTSVWNYDYYHALGEGAFKNEDYVVKYHATHCLDMLRQQLMCTMDTGVLGQVWTLPDTPTPFPDFNTKHTCKNFDAIRQWAEANQLPAAEDCPVDLLEPIQPGDPIYRDIP